MKKLLVLSLLIVLSCTDPFSSRESNPPVNDTGTFVQPVTPQIVLFNLENSFKDLVITNYIACLDSSFVFRYDFVIKQPSATDSGWSYGEESRMTESIFNSMLADTSVGLLVLLSPLIDRPDEAFDTSAVIYRSYILRAIVPNGQAGLDTSEYVGTSIFTMVENEQGLWSIARWEDQHQNTSTPSWADFKNGYR